MAQVLIETPILTLESFVAATCAGDAVFYRLRMADWVNVVAVTRDLDVVLVRQHRWGIEASTLEVPGGIVEEGEDPAVAALRELREETGYGGGKLEPMGWVWSNPAIQNNRTFMYLATGVELLGAPRPDPGEAIDVVLEPADTIRALLDTGAISHALAVLALQRWLSRRESVG